MFRSVKFWLPVLNMATVSTRSSMVDSTVINSTTRCLCAMEVGDVTG